MRWFKYKARHLHRTKQPIFGAWIPSQVKQHAQQRFQRLCCRLPPRTSRGPRTLQLICPSRWEIAPWVVAWGCQVCAWPPWTGNMSWPVWPLAAVPTTSMPSWECGAMRPPLTGTIFCMGDREGSWVVSNTYGQNQGLYDSFQGLTYLRNLFIDPDDSQTWGTVGLYMGLFCPSGTSVDQYTELKVGFAFNKCNSGVNFMLSISADTPLNLFGGLIWFKSFLSYVWSVLPSWFWHTSVSCWMAQAGRSISQHWMEYFGVKTMGFPVF